MMALRGNKQVLFVAGVLTVAVALTVVSAFAGTIQIPKGYEVKLKFPGGMKISSGELTKGVPIVCYLEEPIEIGGITVVEAGAQATAKVAEVKSAGKPGKPGYIKIEFESLDAKGEYRLLTDDKIKLEGSAEAEGKGRKLLSYLFIFGLLIKGTQAEINTNQVYTAEVAENIILETEGES